MALVVIGFGSGNLLAAPISINLSNDLTFGQVTSSVTQAGAVIIDASSGSKTTTGGATDLGGVHSQAAFAVSGDQNTAFLISMPSSITLTGAGSNSVTLNAITSAPVGTGVLNTSGTATVSVGATLNLTANQPPGSYSGSLEVIVNYQ